MFARLSIHTEDNLLAIEDKYVQQGKLFIMNQYLP